MGKSAHPPFALHVWLGSGAVPTTNRNSVKLPRGSELAEIPTRIDELALLTFEIAATIQRPLYGSYCTRGSPTPDTGAVGGAGVGVLSGAQKPLSTPFTLAKMATLERSVPALFWIR